MNTIFSLGLLVCGAVFIGYGLNSADSIGSSFSHFFTGSPTDEAIWMLVGGIAACTLGLSGLVRGSKRKS